MKRLISLFFTSCPERSRRILHSSFALLTSLFVLFTSAFSPPAFAGSIVAWGRNNYGQCNVPEPNTGFVAIAAGGFHNLGLKSDGSIVAWGDNRAGQFDIPSPNSGFIAIAAGCYYSLGLKQDSSIVAWGLNCYGQCNIPSPNSGFIAIAAGFLHSLGLKQDGSIVAWGYNGDGRCNIPEPNIGFIAIAAGGHHSLGLKKDGSIVAWGWNWLGQCDIPSPNSGFIDIAAGFWHSLGLKQDGSIVAWGYNGFGQCNIPSPNSGFIAIAAGWEHSLGLKQDGSIVAWGRNDYSQCNIPSPNIVFITIAAGGAHSLALKADGSIQLKHFEINQCFQEVKPDGRTPMYELIETKPFVVRVNLERITPGTTTANVKLSIVNSKTGEPIGKPPVKEKDATIIYRPSDPKPIDFLFIDNDTKDIKAGDYKFFLIVEDDKGAKFDWTGIYTFKSSRMVRMIVVDNLRFDRKTTNWDNNYIKFTEEVFPIPNEEATDVNHLDIVHHEHYINIKSRRSEDYIFRLLNNYLGKYNDYHPSAPANFICAVVPDGVLPDAVGRQKDLAVLIEDSKDSKYYMREYILAHEIAHVNIYDPCGLGEEYVDSKIKNSDGLWILDQTFNFGTEDKPGNPPPLKLDAGGPFIIGAGRPNAGQRCDWADDKDSYDYEGRRETPGELFCAGRYVGQGGYDLRKEYKPEVESDTFTMMSAPVRPQWISGPEYKALIAELVPTASKSTVKVFSASVSPLNSGQRMLVSGIVDIPAKTAELSPLIPIQNLEPTPEAPDPNCQLKFLSQSGDILGSYNFTPLKGEAPNSHLQGPFCVIVNLPQNTTRIQVTIDGVIADQLRLTDNSPTVSVLSPNGGEELSSEMVITWSASDPDTNDANNLTYTVEFSHNNGTEWDTLTIDQNDNELVVDTNYLPGGPNCLIKVIASDGWNRSEDISDTPFSIPTKPPRVTILDPEDGTTLLHSESMQGRCTAYDPETGDVNDPNAIIWTSSIDGFLGKGNLTGFDLSLGHHTLTATATDPEGKTGADTVTVTVVANFADFNCDRSVDLLDISELAENWQANCSEPDWCGGTDLDRSGVVDFADLTIFCENWLWQANYFSD